MSGEFAPEPPAGTDVAPSLLPASDEYLTFAPFADQLMVQAGQFDVPFTLENRTSDAYTDFIERAMVARSLGAPRNKEVGVMANGLLGDRRFYYSAGLFNGEGPEFRNIDNHRTPSGAWWRRRSLAGDGWWRSWWMGGLRLVREHVPRPCRAGAGDAERDHLLRPRWTTTIDGASLKSCTSRGPSRRSAAS